MASYTSSSRRGFKAGADLSAAQFSAVKLDTNGNVILAVAATDQVIGVLENGPKANDTADVFLRSGNGSYKIKAGGTIAIGQKLTIDSSGRAIYVTGTPTAGNEIVGVALEAGVVGQIIEVLTVFDRI